MIRYTIKLDGQGRVVMTVRQKRDAAWLYAERTARATLEAFGKLDTEAAHCVMRALAVYGYTPMQPGETRRAAISNTGYTISVTRDIMRGSKS